MKKYRILSLLLAGCLLFAGCADRDTNDRGSSYNEDEDRGSSKDKDKDDNSVSGGLKNRLEMQKKYTALQDAAATIRNCVLSSWAEANQLGALGNIEVTGKKSGGKLEITLSGDHTLAAGDDYTADSASTDSPALRFAKCLYDYLVDALSNGSSFYAKINAESFDCGVIYSEDPDNVITGEVNVYIVEDFDAAYEDAKHNPIGASGDYIPK